MPSLDARTAVEDARRCEIFVIGGGPAGSTIGALLAERGRDVVVVDKDRHPRFHIGESLLPHNMPILQRLGVWNELQKIGMPKFAAEFESRAYGKTIAFSFADAFDKRWPFAFQVRRSEFDHLLLRNCAAKGARVLQGVRATAVELGDFKGGCDTLVNVKLEDGSAQSWRTQFLVDASGRDTFLADRLGIKRRNPKHASAALFGHFHNAQRNTGAAEGNITIAWFAHGWFWFIPLKDGTTSVGAVCWPDYMKSRKVDPSAFLLQTIALCPEIAERLRDAQLLEPATATGNYSYASTRMAGDGYLLVGDAWAFVDPVFSSGVYLAMHSAALGADVVVGALAHSKHARRLYREFDRQVRRGVKTFSWLIYRMTSPVTQRLFMAPRNVLGVQTGVISLLAGDVFRAGPLRWRLMLFRLVYYLHCLVLLPTALRAWRERKHVIALAAKT